MERTRSAAGLKHGAQYGRRDDPGRLRGIRTRRRPALGAVRKVRPHGRAEIVVYVENSGDYTVPLTAVRAVHSGKVIVDAAKLDQKLRRAIGHAHDAEDPNA